MDDTDADDAYAFPADPLQQRDEVRGELVRWPTAFSCPGGDEQRVIDMLCARHSQWSAAVAEHPFFPRPIWRCSGQAGPGHERPPCRIAGRCSRHPSGPFQSTVSVTCHPLLTPASRRNAGEQRLHLFGHQRVVPVMVDDRVRASEVVAQAACKS